MINVLVVTNVPWRTDTSVGNTFSNIFSGLEKDLNIIQLYFRDGFPSNEYEGACFHISEKELAKSIVTRKAVGKRVTISKEKEVKEGADPSLPAVYNKARQLRWDSFLLAQDCIGALGNWNSRALDEFIREEKPDIVFGALGRVPVVNDLMRFISRRYSIPLVVYGWDEHYSIKHGRLSPFYYIRAVLERRSLARCAKSASAIFTITPELGEFYSRLFDKPTKLLRKAYDFTSKPEYFLREEDELHLLYAGNIGAGRWKVLARLIDAVEFCNQNCETKAQLDIYTHTPCSPEMKERLNTKQSSLHDGVDARELPALFDRADILVHVESTDVKELEECRYSFSTKIVDYLNAARCILSLGGPTTATNYIKKEKCGVVVNDLDQLPAQLMRLALDKSQLTEYANNAWAVGCKNHRRDAVQRLLIDTFSELLERNATGDRE